MMRILFLGSSEFALPTFRSIRSDGHEIVAVVTQPDKARGRGQRTTPTPVKAAAQEAGIRVLTPTDVNAPDVVAEIKALRPDLAYTAAFGQKIGRELLDAFPAGFINLHPSLLPALRGAAPVQWSVINGDRETGVTVFRLVEKMDAGPILMQRQTAIRPDETADELLDRLARVGCDAVRATLTALAADPKLPGEPQDPAKATFGPKLKKEDGYIRFDLPVDRLAARIRGLWSWPGARCRFRSVDGSRDEQVTIARAVPKSHGLQAVRSSPSEGLAVVGSAGGDSRIGETVPAASPDQLGAVTDMLTVQGVDRELMILEIKPASGKLMDWRSFVNGRHVRAGDRFVPMSGN